MKSHIKRSNSETFCGRTYTVWRRGEILKPSADGKSMVRIPKADEGLHTATVEGATCSSCRNNFRKTARFVVQFGNMQSFIIAAQG